MDIFFPQTNALTFQLSSIVSMMTKPINIISVFNPDHPNIANKPNPDLLTKTFSKKTFKIFYSQPRVEHWQALSVTLH